MKLLEKKYYINKLVKSLNENIFDDFYDEDDDLDSYATHFDVEKLTDCTSKEDIYEYLDNKLNIDDKISTIIREICNNINISLYGLKEILQSDGFFTYFTGRGDAVEMQIELNINELAKSKLTINRYRIEFIREARTFDNIIYRNKPLICDALVLKTDNKEYLSIPLITGDNEKKKQAVLKQIDIYGYIKKTKEYFHDTIDDIIYVNRMVEELICEGKVYKVVYKDIDRMEKCWRTNDYKGFDLITKPDKMVARLAALLIVINKYEHKQITIDDDLLLRLFTKNADSEHYYTARYKRYADVYRVLDRIRKFPTIHIKDILLTYNAYKDKF